VSGASALQRPVVLHGSSLTVPKFRIDRIRERREEKRRLDRITGSTG